MELTGMLTKRGNKLKTWRRRYFELQDNNLCYYVYNGGPRKGEYVVGANTTVVENHLRIYGFCLVQENGRTLYMSADNERDKEMWMNGLREIILAVQAESAINRPNSDRNRILASIDPSHTSEELLEKNPAIVQFHIHLLEARDLAAKGSTDTYAKLIVDSQIVQTKISKKDLNPVWNEIFHFAWSSSLRFVRIEVWDNDPMISARDNFLGVIHLPILSLPQNQVLPKWYKLGKRTSKSHVTGEIRIIAYSDRTPDANAVRLLGEIQKIPELNHGNGLHVTSSNTWNALFQDDASLPSNEFIGRFPTQFPPLETETLEDLSLLVSLRPFVDKLSILQPLYTDGLLLLTNYRLIFVSHRRLADDSGSENNLADHHSQSELSCVVPLASVVSVTMSLLPDPSVLGNSPGPFLDALTIRTNDCKVRFTHPVCLTLSYHLHSRICALSFIIWKPLRTQKSRLDFEAVIPLFRLHPPLLFDFNKNKARDAQS
jgi:hypothetical protein